MRRDVQILNQLGLHARPAAEFVRCAETFTSEIIIWKGGEQFSGTSILQVLSANLRYGSKFDLEAVGSDEQQALDHLSALFHSFKFDEEKEDREREPAATR